MKDIPDRRDDSLAGLPRSHDAYFKAMLLWPALRADLVRCLLPPTVQPLLAAGEPALEGKDFQGPALQERRVDALLKVPLRGASPDDCLFLLLEHKSKPSPGIHTQLAAYHAALMEQQEVAHEKEPPGRRQRPVVKWVIYNGREEWRIPRHSGEQAGHHPALAEAATASFYSGYELLDLRQTPVAHLYPGSPRLRAFLLALRGHISGRALAMRRRKQPDLWQQPEPPLEKLLTLMAEGFKDAPEHVKDQHLCYIMANQHWASAQEATVKELVAKPLFGNEEGGTRMLSILERREQAGKIEGRAEGMTQGRAEGEARGIASMLINLLGGRFGAAAVSEYEARIREADVKQLGIWTERVLDAPSIEAVFDRSPLPQRTRLNGEP